MIWADSSIITHDGFLPSPVFLVSRLNALNMVWLSPAFLISYLLRSNQFLISSVVVSTNPLAESNTIVACSRFVANVNTSAPASPNCNSYKPIADVNVDLPALRGMNTMTSVTIRFVWSFFALNP